MTDRVTKRSLNRALLARQLLLEPSTMTPAAAIEHLVGLQAQLPNPPYIGLWTRLAGFRFEDLAQLIRDHKVVRMALMRNTIHLVTASDAKALRPLLQSAMERRFRSVSWGKSLVGVDLEPVMSAARVVVDSKAVSFAELGAILVEQFPALDAAAMAQAARTYIPLVQVPPRGIWGKSGQARHMSTTAWLGPESPPSASLDDLVLRYLAAFGPASIADIQAWSGLTRLRAVADHLAGELVVLHDEDGTELFDLPEAPRPDADTPAPIRFLPEWDNVLLSHADRTRILSDADRLQIFTANGIVPGCVLVDGFVSAVWRKKTSRATEPVTLEVEPLRRLSKSNRDAVLSEGHRLLDAVADRGAHNVIIQPTAS
jgi:hypothetical protein